MGSESFPFLVDRTKWTVVSGQWTERCGFWFLFDNSGKFLKILKELFEKSSLSRAPQSAKFSPCFKRAAPLPAVWKE